MRELTFLLHQRGETIAGLAKKAGVGRAHLHEVLAGRPQHGHRTRPRIVPFLTSTELAMLGWDKNGTVVPCGTDGDGWRRIRWVALVRLIEQGWAWTELGLMDRQHRLWDWKLESSQLMVRLSVRMSL
jgi:hypothetical protein